MDWLWSWDWNCILKGLMGMVILYVACLDMDSVV